MMMKNRQKSVVDIARVRLDHVPFVVTNNRRMAVWSDVREILLWCPSPHCCVVLDTLKMILGYPAYETMMHPCSQLEQLMFFKHYMFVPNGTLLVDVDSLREGAKLSILYQTVKDQHNKPDSPTVSNCTKMLKTFTEKYANTSFKIPLTAVSNKILLPAVFRVWKYATTCEDGCIDEREHLQQFDLEDGNKLEATKSEEQLTVGRVNSSKMLVPLSLLWKLYPGCEVFLDDVVRLYVLGQCSDENLQSVCQCTTEEGIQLTRFLASQNGYDSSWWCVTPCSLMISWSEFWLGINRVCGGRLEVLSKDVCVVTLSCEMEENEQDQKTSAKSSNNTVMKQRMPTCPSPTLSTITDITKNIQSQSITNSPTVLSPKSQNSFTDKANTCKCDQNFISDKKSKLDCNTLHSEKTINIIKEKNNVNLEDINKKDHSETIQDKVYESNLMTDERKNKNEKQDNITKKKQTMPEKNDKKNCESSFVTRKLRNGTILNLNEGDSKAKKQGISLKVKKNKTNRKKRNSRESLENKVTKIENISSDMKSRLRNKNQNENTISNEENTLDANNSALVNNKLNSLKKSGFGDSHNCGTKSIETNVSICPVAEKSTERNSMQYKKLKIELPMTEVTSYDLATINCTDSVPEADNRHVSIKPKCIDLHSDNIPGEISPEIPLVAKQNIGKKNVDTLQSIRNRREILKIHSAKLQDEIPDNLKYTPKSSDTKRSSPLNVDHFYSVQKNRCKIENKKESRNEEKDMKLSKLEYLSLTPKQLELTGPVLRCPSPSKLQNSKAIPFKQVKAVIDDTFRRNRTEALVHRPRTDPVSVILQGKPLHQNMSAGPFKHELHGQQNQLDNSSNKKNESTVYSTSTNKYGTLHQEIVSNLQKKTDHSISSSRKLLTAEGKAVRRHERETDLNSSDFMKERITMWKDELEHSLNDTSSSGRQIKSADFVRQKKMCTYRPRSSIYTSQFDQSGISIKTALCALHSRERASPDMFDKQSQVEARNNEMQKCTENCSYQNLANSKTLWVPKRGSNDKRSGTGKGHIKQDCQYDVQNFGSSSSLTPDMYDEFARKRKPKSLKIEIEKNKARPNTIPIPTTLSQPIVRRQDQTTSVTIKKPNYHTVGYMSEVNSTQDQIVDQQIYHRYTNAISTQTTPVLDSIDSRLVCKSDAKKYMSSENKECDESDESCETVSEIDCDRKVFPQKVLSNLSVKSDKKTTKIAGEESLTGNYSLHCININDTREDIDVCSRNDGRQKTDTASMESSLNTTDKKNNKVSAVKNLSKYKDLVISPGRVESIDVVSRIQALTDKKSLSINTKQDSFDTVTKKSTKYTQQIQPEKCSTFIDNADDTIERYNQAIINCQRLKTKLANDENKISETNLQEVETMGHYFSKLNTQLYYKTPGDDKFHPVSGNILIPKDAQFFLHSALPKCNTYADNIPFSQDRKDNESQSFCSEASYKGDDSNVVNRNVLVEGNLPALPNTDEEDDKLSCTTFDSILKASEDLIDKSRIFKHIINETKEAIERTEIEEGIEKEASAVKDLVDKCKVTTADETGKEIYSKVIASFLRSAAEGMKAEPKKSFKEIIDEKREEKRRIQQQLSKKKYWNSAHSINGIDCNSSKEKRFDKKANSVSDKSKELVENKQSKQKSNVKNKNTLRSDRKINSKFISTSQKRPKSCVGLHKGKVGNTLTCNGGKTKKDTHFMNVKSHTDVITKKKSTERNGIGERIKYYQNNKPSKIFPRAKPTKSKKETDDCTNKILTALRRLSIEKSPKHEEPKGCSKHEVRTSKLRSSVAKRASSVTNVKSSQAVQVNVLEKSKPKSGKNEKEHNLVHNDEVIQEKGLCDIANVSKIPVLISNRDDIGHCDIEHNASEVFDGGIKDNGYFISNTFDRSDQRQCLELEQAYCEGMDKELTKQISNHEMAIVEKTDYGEEVFITLYDSHELGLYTLDQACYQSSVNLSSDCPQAAEEKYLGIPYIEGMNANMNNLEVGTPHEHGLIVSKMSPENDTHITALENNIIQTESVCPRKFSQVQIPTVSTVCIRSQNLNHNEEIIGSNMAGLKHRTVIQDKTVSEINKDSSFAHDVNDNDDGAFISYTENEGHYQDHENLTLNAHDFLKSVEGITKVDIDKFNDDSLNSKVYMKKGTHQKWTFKDDLKTPAYETEYLQSCKHASLLENSKICTDSNCCTAAPPESVVHKANTQGIVIETRATDIHSLETAIGSNFKNHINQNKNDVAQSTNQGFPEETLYVCSNNDLNGEVFLDETECGQEVYVGNIDDIFGQDLENGLGLILDTETIQNCSPDRYDDRIEERKQEIYDSSEDNCNNYLKNLQNAIYPGESTEDKRSKNLNTEKRKNVKEMTIVKNQPELFGQLTYDYSPSQSEIDAYFWEVTKITGIADKEEVLKIARIADKDVDSDTGSKSEDSLPEFTQDYRIKRKSKIEVGDSNIIPKHDNCSINEELNDDVANDGDVDETDDDDVADAESDNVDPRVDDGDDDDYNPDEDMDEFHALNDSDSDSNASEQSSGKRKTHKKKAKSGPDVNMKCNNIFLGKHCKVSLEKVRTNFQKKYDVKNSSTIRDLERKLQKKNGGYFRMKNVKCIDSDQPKEQVKSIVRQFCLKQSQHEEKGNNTESNFVFKNESQFDSEIVQSSKDSTRNYNSEMNNISSYSDSSLSLSDEQSIRMKGKNRDRKHKKSKYSETKDIKNGKSIKKKKKKVVKDALLDDSAGLEQKTEKEENIAAEGFIKTQKRYYEILRHSNIGGSCKREAEVSVEQSEVTPAIEEFSDVLEAVPVHGERVITKALSEAEKALEGTGSLDDIHDDAEGVVVEDLINQCRYQMIEDEDHVQLGGMAHLKDFALPFVYINGYKYTPLKDALTIFTQECCVTACTIPRSVLQKQKRLIKSLSSWEQVYKLELIKMKKGPSIKTGDMLVKLDTLLAYLPELTQAIVDLHKGTKLKRSQSCDITAYETLKSKFKMS